MEQADSKLSSEALALTGLAVEYCTVAASAAATEPSEFIASIVKYLPRLYIMLTDLRPYGQDSMDFESFNTEMINSQLSEEDYETVRSAIATVLGEYDTYLDATQEHMQYSESPVVVDLSMQLADIFQAMVDFAATMKAIDIDTMPDVLAEMKYRFHTYLSDIICSALRAANNIYQSGVLSIEE